jgi:hypothetical protein
MSIIKTVDERNLIFEEHKADTKLLMKKMGQADSEYKPSDYRPTDEEKDLRSMILSHFMKSILVMKKPRPEFNDMSVLDRYNVDYMSFNTYQANNGDAYTSDALTSWRSNAVRPVVRNKVISIAAHSTARVLFPKVFAYDQSNNENRDAATVMTDLLEWSGDQSNYQMNNVYKTLSSLIEPAAISYTDYCETYRNNKVKKDSNGKWQYKKELDEDLSGFKEVQVPCNELYIENIYERDIQKQGWLIWRKVISYQLAEAKYSSKYNNFKYVYPGVQIVADDINQNFYQAYDNTMRQDCVEEIMYWNKTFDLLIIMVNGVILTDADNPNPRIDKQYPFTKFYFEPIMPHFFYGKSLVFKIQSDANIVNNLYQMIIDGTYLNLFPPMVQTGGEAVMGDVIVPGGVTAFKDPNTQMSPIQLANNMNAGMNTLSTVMGSLSESSQEPIMQGASQGGSQTAYEISRVEQNANTVMGLFLKNRANEVVDFGKLRISDIIQYMTIADVDKLESNSDLVYRTFYLQDKNVGGKSVSKKIELSNNVPVEMSEEDKLSSSYDVLSEEEGHGKDGNNIVIYKVNPSFIRDLKYKMAITPDVINPMSEDLERAFNLEAYDRLIQNPLVDQEAVTREFLLGSYPKSKKDVDKFLKKQEENPMAQGMPGMPQQNNQSPLASLGATQNNLPQQPMSGNI